jgi:carbamate kinase
MAVRARDHRLAAHAPSPEPLGVLDPDMVALLLAAGVVVVCGGGGVPVVADFNGRLHGVGAVVSAELAVGVLARQIDIDRLVLPQGTDLPPERPDHTRGVTPTVGAGTRPGTHPRRPRCPPARSGLPLRRVHRRRASVGPLQYARAVLDGNSGTLVVADHRSAGYAWEFTSSARKW